MTSTNDITKDRLVSKPSSDLFRENFDKIFGSKAKSTDPSKRGK